MMKGSHAVQRQIIDVQAQLPANSTGLADDVLARSIPEHISVERPRILSIPAEKEPFLNAEVAPSPAPDLRVRRRFPYHEFASTLDPAVVKARHLVGPVDPTILFVGDLDERHGPDLLVRAMPLLLKKHPQARLVIVGDGPLVWPLRVMSRYMLLDYAVRIAGHVGGAAIRELVAAADVMAVPSRSPTEDWQILSGWSARRPVVATPAVSNGLCANGENSLVVDCAPAALGAALDRLLSDASFGRQIGDRGYRKLIDEFDDES
jgi:glycosyltransferase involved in cell wall biosynthesis